MPLSKINEMFKHKRNMTIVNSDWGWNLKRSSKILCFFLCNIFQLLIQAINVGKNYINIFIEDSSMWLFMLRKSAHVLFILSSYIRKYRWTIVTCTTKKENWLVTRFRIWLPTCVRSCERTGQYTFPLSFYISCR